MAIDPDPRTAPDDDEDATNDGVSSPEPAEGPNDESSDHRGSAKG